MSSQLNICFLTEPRHVDVGCRVAFVGHPRNSFHKSADRPLGSFSHLNVKRMRSILAISTPHNKLACSAYNRSIPVRSCASVILLSFLPHPSESFVCVMSLDTPWMQSHSSTSRQRVSRLYGACETECYTKLGPSRIVLGKVVLEKLGMFFDTTMIESKSDVCRSTKSRRGAP